MNQYQVVLETLPEFQKNPAKLQDIYVRSLLAPPSTPNASGSSASTANQPLTATTAGAPGAGTTGPNGSTPAAPTGSANPIATTTVNGAAVPLSTFTHFETLHFPLAVTPQLQFPAAPIPSNPPPTG